jgi:hypothetical protein
LGGGGSEDNHLGDISGKGSKGDDDGNMLGRRERSMFNYPSSPVSISSLHLLFAAFLILLASGEVIECWQRAVASVGEAGCLVTDVCDIIMEAEAAGLCIKRR